MKSLIGRSFDITVLNEQKRKKTRFIILAIAVRFLSGGAFGVR